ncbi:MAG: hypothetical protein ACRBDL_01120 [Alphaproteobacteria bacterium]
MGLSNQQNISDDARAEFQDLETLVSAAKNGDLEAKFQVWQHNDRFSDADLTEAGASHDQQVEWLIEYIESDDVKEHASLSMFYLAQEYYNSGIFQDQTDDLLHEAFHQEFDNLVLNGDLDEDAESLERFNYLFGIGAGAYEVSDYAQHVLHRTMDALNEIQDEAGQDGQSATAQGDGISRGFTNYSGTDKSQITEQAAERVRALEDDKEKMSALLRYMQEVQGIDLQKDLDKLENDG